MMTVDDMDPVIFKMGAEQAHAIVYGRILRPFVASSSPWAVSVCCVRMERLRRRLTGLRDIPLKPLHCLPLRKPATVALTVP